LKSFEGWGLGVLYVFLFFHAFLKIVEYLNNEGHSREKIRPRRGQNILAHSMGVIFLSH